MYLRERLELFQIKVWEDSTRIYGGDPLKKTIIAAIENSSHFIVILSLNTVNSEWVPKEIEWAKAVKEKREGYRLIPILLKEMTEKALSKYLGEDDLPLAIKLLMTKIFLIELLRIS